MKMPQRLCLVVFFSSGVYFFFITNMFGNDILSSEGLDRKKFSSFYMGMLILLKMFSPEGEGKWYGDL